MSGPPNRSGLLRGAYPALQSFFVTLSNTYLCISSSFRCFWFSCCMYGVSWIVGNRLFPWGLGSSLVHIWVLRQPSARPHRPECFVTEKEASVLLNANGVDVIWMLDSADRCILPIAGSFVRPRFQADVEVLSHLLALQAIHMVMKVTQTLGKRRTYRT